MKYVFAEKTIRQPMFSHTFIRDSVFQSYSSKIKDWGDILRWQAQKSAGHFHLPQDIP